MSISINTQAAQVRRLFNEHQLAILHSYVVERHEGQSERLLRARASEAAAFRRLKKVVDQIHALPVRDFDDIVLKAEAARAWVDWAEDVPECCDPSSDNIGDWRPIGDLVKAVLENAGRSVGHDAEYLEKARPLQELLDTEPSASVPPAYARYIQGEAHV